MGKPLTIEDYQTIGISRGFTWLGNNLPKNTKEKTLFRCTAGHVWEAVFSDIKQGHGCPYCYEDRRGTSRRYTLEKYQKLAEDRGFLWTGDILPKTTGTKTKWRCPNRHEWDASYNSIQQKHGCPHCNNQKKNESRKITRDGYHRIAIERGFLWVGDSLPKTTALKTLFRCSQGHEWLTSYNAITHGNGCPHCSDMVNGVPISRQQRKIHSLIGGELNYRVHSRTARYCIDIALDTSTLFPIAVEYDCWYWHSKIEKHDAERDQWLLAHGWRILHIRSGKFIPTLDQLNTAIGRLRHDDTYLEIIMPDWNPTA